MRLVVRLLAVAALPILAAPMAASGAQFYQVPDPGQTSGAGPFRFTFTTTGSGSMSGHAYKLSTEPYWHRCLAGITLIELRNLALGTHTVQIADDISLNYWASQGQL